MEDTNGKQSIYFLSPLSFLLINTSSGLTKPLPFRFVYIYRCISALCPLGIQSKIKATYSHFERLD